MGQIPLSSIVTVNISVSPTFPARAGFGTLLCVTKETGVLSLAERVRSYGSVDAVSADWGATSEVTKMATTYFSQSPKPTSFMVGIRFENAVGANLKGGTYPSTELATLQAITDGSFNISIDGTSAVISGLSFAAATSMDDVALVIQAALRAEAVGGFTLATCVYDTDHFVITSGTTGATSTISYLTPTGVGTDLSELLSLDQGASLKSDGVDAETITASLSALEEANSSWYGFAFTKEVRDDVVINGEDAVEAAADWAEARVKVFFTTTNNELTLLSASTTDIAYVLRQKNLSRTLVIFSNYPSEYPEVSVAGRAFSVDFTAGNPLITLKFKQLPGITVEDLSYSQKLAIEDKGVNALIAIAGNIFLAEGVVSGGRFFDEIHGLDWLQNAIQTNVFGALYTSRRIPYTDAGIQILAQQVRNALAEAVTAGLLAPGTDANGNFLSEGYVVNTVPEAQVSQSNKEARFYNGLSFTALGAGAIHSVTVNGVFER